MSLLKTEANKSATPSFEAEDDVMTNAAPNGEPQVESEPKSEPQTAAPKTTAVAIPPQYALKERMPLVNVLSPLQNAMRVEYNTLESIIASQGNFKSRETNKSLGDEVVFEVLSFQDSFVVSPGDDKAPQDVVRYSDDGLTCSDGTSVQEHLHWLKTNGYPKASIKPRVVLVGAIESTSKASDLVGALVQFDLSPTSRVQWNRYMANSAFMVRAGKVTPDQLLRVRAVAESAMNGTNEFTLAKFFVADAA